MLHSFGGAGEAARPFLELGFYFSISGSVTRQNARKVLSLIDYLPTEAILVETDAPSIALEDIPPADVDPSHIPLVLDAIARRKSISPETLREQIALEYSGPVRDFSGNSDDHWRELPPSRHDRPKTGLADEHKMVWGNITRRRRS